MRHYSVDPWRPQKPRREVLEHPSYFEQLPGHLDKVSLNHICTIQLTLPAAEYAFRQHYGQGRQRSTTVLVDLPAHAVLLAARLHEDERPKQPGQPLTLYRLWSIQLYVRLREDLPTRVWQDWHGTPLKPYTCNSEIWFNNYQREVEGMIPGYKNYGGGGSFRERQLSWRFEEHHPTLRRRPYKSGEQLAADLRVMADVVLPYTTRRFYALNVDELTPGYDFSDQRATFESQLPLKYLRRKCEQPLRTTL